ncbi:MAG: AsnC family transcriptional regulator [Salinirussus sp.]
MNQPDETDLEILELLLADGRRPYSDIADAVGLSAPAVSDRVAKLEELGIIRRFTVDIDRSQLESGIPVLVSLDLTAEAGSVRDALLEAGPTEHVFTTAEGNLVVAARVPDSDVSGWLDETVEDGAITEISVRLRADSDWSPEPSGTGFALQCAECGNTVDSEGTATRLDGTLYQFCCPSCESRFVEQHERLRKNAD